MIIYEPREDSCLLAAAVKKHAYGNLLEIGTGSGVLAITSAKNKRVKNVIATDINKKAVAVAKKNAASAKIKKIKFITSDLFKNLPPQRFDTIIFNPPYLPRDKEFYDKTIHGGKKGYEIIEKFLNSCSSYLKPKGIILLLFSSLTKKERVDEIISSYCYDKELLHQKQIFFETLYVYKVKKSQLLQLIEKKGIKNLKLFAKGHRGMLYKGKYKKIAVAVKAERKDTAAVGRVENEINWLKKLNKYNIGPELLFYGNDYFCYEFVKGKFIIDFISSNSREKITGVIKNLLQQCRTLDRLKVDKEEMHHPWKHIVIGEKIVLLDFERCHYSEKPKNVTQFCQFLKSKNMLLLLKKKRIQIDEEGILAAAKRYKSSYSEKDFNAIAKVLRIR
jgi:release factor glutamine methyltransferase